MHATQGKAKIVLYLLKHRYEWGVIRSRGSSPSPHHIARALTAVRDGDRLVDVGSERAQLSQFYSFWTLKEGFVKVPMHTARRQHNVSGGGRCRACFEWR
jgi:hypothetical protein